MFELLFMGGIVAAGGAIAWAIHSQQQKARAQRWAAAAQALGPGATLRATGSGYVIEGQHDNLGFSARLRTVSKNKKTYEYVDVTAVVRLPLPHGLAIDKETGFSAIKNLFGATSSRPNVVQVGSLRVRAGDVASARALFGHPELQQWLRRAGDRSKKFGLVANRVSMSEFDADSADEIVRAVKTTVRTVQELEDAILWRPERHKRLALQGAPARAFGIGVPETEAPEIARAEPSAPPPQASHEPALVDRMLSDLSAEGTVVDERGAFTIDREAALRKLRSSRVDRSATFVLEILRAAALRGATQVHVTADADDLEIEFDGQPFTRRDLEDCFGSAFASSPDPVVQARRHLALGLEGALGISPRFIELEGPLASMRRVPDEDDQFVEGDAARDTTRFAVKLKLLDRMRGGAFNDTLGMIRHHAVFMSAAVTINEQLIDRGPPHERWWGQLDLSLPGPTAPIEVYLGFGVGDAFGLQGRAWLGRHQVWVETRELRQATPRLRVAVMAHDFNTDLSGQRLVDDEEARRILGAIEPHVEAAIVQLAADYGEARRRGDLRQHQVAAVLRAVVIEHLSWEQLRNAETHEVGSMPHALVSAKIWPAFDGNPRSIRDLSRGLDDATVPYVSVGLHGTVAVHGKFAGERLHARLGRGLSAHAIDVSKLGAHERQWVASVFGSRLKDETWDMLRVAWG